MVHQQIEADVTRATARLPGLEIEIVHRQPADNVEQISINLQATPSFDAFGRFLEVATPFVFWSRMVELAWLPWSGAARMMMLPWAAAAAPPQLRSPDKTNAPKVDDA